MSPCVRMGGAICCYSRQYEVTAESGRRYRFDWTWSGPSFRNADDSEKRRVPREAWAALERWLKTAEGKEATR